MANLGKLWFDLGLKDKSEEDIKKIFSKIEKRFKDANIDISFNKDALNNSIKAALEGEQFKIDVIIDKANTTKLVQEALAKHGYDFNVSPSDVRAERISEIQQRMAEMQERNNAALVKYKAQIENINKLSTEKSEQIALLEERLKKAREDTAAATARRAKAEKSLSGSQEAAVGSIKMLESELSKLKNTYRSLSEADRNSSIGTTMLKQINDADENLAKINSAMANNAALAKAMGTRYNGLQVQISQVMRELPNLGISLSTFIISLSNNLPFLADAIANANKEIQTMRDAGKTVTPVWKQMLGALLNWQTALIVGVTVLVAYSREIETWIEQLIKGGESYIYLAESQEKYNNLLKTASKNAAEEIGKLEMLFRITQDTALSIDTRRKAVEELQKAYPDYLGSLSEEAILAGEASEAYRHLAKSIENSAALRLIEEQRAEAIEKLAKAKEKEAEEQERINALMKELDATSEEKLIENAYKFSRNYGNYISNLIRSRNSYKKQQDAILEDTEKWAEKYSDLFDKSVNEGQLDILFNQMPEYTEFGKKVEDLRRSLSLGEIMQEEFNKRVNDAKGVLLEAADAAKIGGSEVEKIRDEYIAFNKIQNNRKSGIIDTYKQDNTIIKANEQLKQAIINAETELAKAQISLMADGGEKQIAQLKLNHKKRLEEIEKESNDLILKARELEKAEWIKENPNKKDSEFKSSINSVEDLPENIRNLLKKLLDTETQVYKKEITDYYESVAKEFEGYLKKRESLAKEYAQKESVLLKSGASSDTLKELYKQREEAYKSIDLQFAQREREFEVWSKYISNLGINQLRRMLIEAQAELLKTEISDPGNAEDLAKYRAQIIKLREEIDNIKGEGKKVDVGSKEWKDIYEVLVKVDRTFGEIGDSVGGTAGEIIKQAGKSASSVLQLANAINTVKTAAKGLEKASVILTAISAGVQLVSNVFSWFSSRDYMEKFQNEADELNETLITIKENARIEGDDFNTIFGDNVWGNAINNINAANEALENYNSTLEEIKNRKYYSSFDSDNGLWGDRDMSLGYITNMKKEFDDVSDSIANMQLQIRHSTWFRKAKYTSLKDAVPELFGSDGNVDIDALKEFVNSDMFEKLSEQDKKYLQGMLNDWDTYQNAVSEVNDYLTDIFGDLGSSISDSIVDAFKNGTDAAQAFTDSVSDMLENLATQMAYSLYIAPYLEDAQKEVNDIISNETLNEGEKADKIGEVLDETMGEIGGVTDAFYEFLEDRKEAADKLGYDIFGPDDQEGSSSGLSSSIQGVTEDTANVLGSYLNAIRQDVSVSRHFMENISVNLLPTLSVTAQAQLQQLNVIAENTRINAEAAESIRSFLYDSLSGVIVSTSGGKAFRIK